MAQVVKEPQIVRCSFLFFGLYRTGILPISRVIQFKSGPHHIDPEDAKTFIIPRLLPEITVSGQTKMRIFRALLLATLTLTSAVTVHASILIPPNEELGIPDRGMSYAPRGLAERDPLCTKEWYVTLSFFLSVIIILFLRPSLTSDNYC
jgi:hypothetical protein